MASGLLATGRVAIAPSNQQRAATLGLNLFALVYMFATYTNIAWWNKSQLVVPSLAPLVISAVFFLYNPLKFTRRLLLAYAGIVIAVFVFYILTSFQLGSYKFTILLTTVNFCYSILVALGGFAIFTSSTRERTARSFAFFAAFLLIGAVLEQLGPLRPLSEVFRHAVYPTWILYGEGEASLRDVVQYGGYRPRVFASEPSIVGIWAALSATGWLLLYPVRLLSRRTAIYLGYCAVMLYIVRSPTILFSIPILLFTRLSQGGGRPMSATVARLVGPLRFATFLTAFLALGRLVSLLPTTGALQFIGGTSFFERIVAPQFMTARVIENDPLLGIGIGNKDELWAMTQRLFMDTLPDAKQLLDTQESAVALISNSFYMHWISCGLVGGVVMLFIYAGMMRRLGIRDTAAVGAVAICFMFTMGGYTGTLVWSVIMILAAVRLQYENKGVALERSSRPASLRPLLRTGALRPAPSPPGNFG